MASHNMGNSIPMMMSLEEGSLPTPPSYEVSFETEGLFNIDGAFARKDNNKSTSINLKEVTLPTFAIAFDIDGVLVRGKDPISNAKRTLEQLQSSHVPYILLTNGGGYTEATHASMVSQRIGVPVDNAQFFQSHTPFLAFMDMYKDQWVLCLGGEKTKIKELARAYGFTAANILSSSDLVKQDSKIHPFSEMTAAHHQEHGSVADKFGPDEAIAAIFVFSSPRDWCLDLQVCLDLLASEGGKLGKRSSLNGNAELPNYGYQQDGQPMLYFCNPDLEWATSYPQPRLAQGGFRSALEGIWSSFTGGKAPLRAWSCGKPTETTFEYAELAIHKYRKKLSPGTEIPELRTIYMIGDNPNSDIAGANAADKISHIEWKSVLVETGVYKEGTVPEHMPSTIKKDVSEAIEWVMEQEDEKRRRAGDLEMKDV